jgi:FkbM family methyltransferase
MIALCMVITSIGISCNQERPPEPEKMAFADFLKANPKIYSQFDEEVIIRHFFNDRRNGFYLDVGCAEANLNSTTYYLEQHLEWKGIGIDALDGYRFSWEELRPKSKFVSVAITDHSGDTIKFYDAHHLSSTKEDWVKRYGWTEKPKPIEVNTMTLNDLLKKEGVKKIDFMSIDIEGSEPPALTGFDIEYYKPELVCIEYATNEEKILDYFNKHGYKRLEEYLPFDKYNWYFKPKKK